MGSRESGVADPEPRPRHMMPSELLKVEVEHRHAIAAAGMTDEKLVKVWLGTALFAALGGPDSIFYKVLAAVVQEMKWRGLKAKGMLE